MEGSKISFPAELFGGIEQNLVPSSRLQATQYRLDAPAFLSQDLLSSLIPSSLGTTALSKLAEVFTVYIQSPILAYVAPFKGSRPYMTTSELAEYQAGYISHVSLTADPRLRGWEIKRGTIVVSRSGRVGEAYWVDRKLDGVLVGDSFRVVPKKSEDAYFLYAVLASAFARSFLSGSAYGSVVDHASLDQLRNFPLPTVSPDARAEITGRIKEAVALREEASDLLDNAQDSVLSCNGLPRLPDALPGDGIIQAVFVSSAEILKQEGGVSEFRLEAHFHNPRARVAIDNIRKSPSPKRLVGQLTKRLFLCNRFTRTFVEAEHGIPYLAGKHIVQVRPSIENYLSISQTEELDTYKLQRGWILITCSGTLGRTCFVWRNFEEYVATHDLVRVVADDTQVDPGYLYAMLSSAYGFEQILRFRHGSVIDHVTPEQVAKLLVPLPDPASQKEIGDKVRLAYEKRAGALKLEDEAQGMLLRELKGDLTKER